MAIEYFTGFEDVGALTTEFTTEWTLAPAQIRTTAGARTGSGYLDVGTAPCTLNLPATAKKTVGFATMTTNTNAFSNTVYLVIQFCTDVGATAHLSVNFDLAGHLQLRRGTGAGTVIATSTQIMDISVYRYVEAQATIDDATGRCIVKVDGVTWIDFTGDTRNAGTSVNIDAVKFSGFTSSTPRIDDLVVMNATDDTAVTGRPDNDFLGDVKVEPLLPSADGAASAWTPSTGTAHAALVDEVPPNSTDYVAATTNALQDLWALADLNAADTAVLAIRGSYYAQKTDAGAASLKPAIRESSGTVTVESTAIPLSTSYAVVTSPIRKTKPGGGAWSVADVNGLQLGVEKA